VHKSLTDNGLIRFNGFELDTVTRTLTREGQPVSLSPRTFDLLVYLAAHSGTVVTKDELLSAVWPGSFVEESNLSQHIFLLRKTLAAAGHSDHIVATVHGKGYQFAARVELIPRGHRANTGSASDELVLHAVQSVTRVVVEEETDEEEVAGMAPKTLALTPGAKPRSRRLVWSAAAVAAIAVFFVIRVNTPSQLRIASYQQITHDGNSKLIGGTDGSRIYFTEEVPNSINEVSVSGGVAAPISIPVEYRWAGDISPDGSTLLVISQAGGLGPGDSLWSFRILGGSLHRIANALDATWSPDGEGIVYATANGDIYQSQSDGAGSHKLISTGGYIKSLAWSPDGRLIRFSKDGLLWEMDANGANLRQLLPGWGKSSTQWSGQWARDGRFYFVSDGQIWMMNERSVLGKRIHATPVQLTFGPTVWDRPVLSRDGKRIFASGRTKRGELIRLDPKSRHFHTFLDGMSAEFLTYSRDARSMAYVTFPEGILWRANPDGSHPMQLTYPPVYPKSPRWSPDGTKILFVDSTSQGVNAIYMIPSDGSERPQRLLPDDRDAETDPSWSPDGRKVVFSTTQNVGASSTSELRILDVATNSVITLPASSGLTVPRWSPDGKSIAAMTLDAMSMRIFTPATGRWFSLNSGSVAFPEWSRDSRFLYYINWHGDGSLVRNSVANGKTETIADLKGSRFAGFYTSWMALDPEDAPLMLRDIGRDDIYALTLEKK